MPGMPNKLLLLLALCAAAALRVGAVAAAEPGFLVVAAPGAPGTGERRLSRDAVARIFLRKQNFWENGLRNQPANLPANHPLRRQFSQALLGSPPEALEDYWRDMYFHGVLPPHVLASEEAVVLFVTSTPGAIGYVSSCAAARKLVVVLVVGEPADCTK